MCGRCRCCHLSPYRNWMANRWARPDANFRRTEVIHEGGATTQQGPNAAPPSKSTATEREYGLWLKEATEYYPDERKSLKLHHARKQTFEKYSKTSLPLWGLDGTGTHDQVKRSLRLKTRLNGYEAMDNVAPTSGTIIIAMVKLIWNAILLLHREGLPFVPYTSLLPRLHPRDDIWRQMRIDRELSNWKNADRYLDIIHSFIKDCMHALLLSSCCHSIPSFLTTTRCSQFCPLSLSTHSWTLHTCLQDSLAALSEHCYQFGLEYLNYILSDSSWVLYSYVQTALSVVLL